METKELDTLLGIATIHSSTTGPQAAPVAPPKEPYRYSDMRCPLCTRKGVVAFLLPWGATPRRPAPRDHWTCYSCGYYVRRRPSGAWEFKASWSRLGWHKLESGQDNGSSRRPPGYDLY
jgi:hypothetical protein